MVFSQDSNETKIEFLRFTQLFSDSSPVSQQTWSVKDFVNTVSQSPYESFEHFIWHFTFLCHHWGAEVHICRLSDVVWISNTGFFCNNTVTANSSTSDTSRSLFKVRHKTGAALFPGKTLCKIPDDCLDWTLCWSCLLVRMIRNSRKTAVGNSTTSNQTGGLSEMVPWHVLNTERENKQEITQELHWLEENINLLRTIIRLCCTGNCVFSFITGITPHVRPTAT